MYAGPTEENPMLAIIGIIVLVVAISIAAAQYGEYRRERRAIHALWHRTHPNEPSPETRHDDTPLVHEVTDDPAYGNAELARAPAIRVTG